jgi:hypothetical protein
MEINKALDQITEIHGQLAKTDANHSYGSVSVTLSGVIALIAAAVQPVFFGGDASPLLFVFYWVVLACIAVVIASIGIIYGYFRQKSLYERRKTLTAIGQLTPCIVAGAVFTLILVNEKFHFIGYLPGIWVMLFSLGIFASRPYLPGVFGWVALFYLVCGSFLIYHQSMSPWGMGLTFGIGQILSGILLYWNLERKNVKG